MNILYRTKTGSNLYGTTLPTSDVDWKTIYLPDYNSILLGKKIGIHTSKTNNSGDKNTPSKTLQSARQPGSDDGAQRGTKNIKSYH